MSSYTLYSVSRCPVNCAVNQYPDTDGADEKLLESPVIRRTQSKPPTVSTTLNINDLPLPSNTRDLALYQSAVFIEDGVKYRSIHHKIGPQSLKIYQVYYSW